MLLSRRFLSTAAVAPVLLALGLLVGPAAAGGPGDAPSAGEIAKLVKQFDADDFSDREAASGKLAEAGIATVSTSISISSVNGVKTIDVNENGRQIKIHDNPKAGIKVQVTETKAGKQVTKVIEAKNAEELKKADQEAYDLYKQYQHGGAIGGMIQVQIQAGGIPGRVQLRPIGPGQFGGRVQLLPGGARPSPAKQIEAATRQLQHIGRQLNKATKDAEHSDQLRQALKQFQAELDKQLSQVEKALSEKAESPSGGEH